MAFTTVSEARDGGGMSDQSCASDNLGCTLVEGGDELWETTGEDRSLSLSFGFRRVTGGSGGTRDWYSQRRGEGPSRVAEREPEEPRVRSDRTRVTRVGS